jgi:predicted nuclease of predicted toxin-antitoxin system
MKFLVDECTGPAVAAWLHAHNHDVFSVFDQAKGMVDDDVIRKALAEQRILITNDKDFGDKVYRNGRRVFCAKGLRKCLNANVSRRTSARFSGMWILLAWTSAPHPVSSSAG